MAVYLSPIGNNQVMDSNGAPLVGGYWEVYLAGTTTPRTTYTSNTGLVPQPAQITLDASGRPANPIWITGGVPVKFRLSNSAAEVLLTIDNVSGINDPTAVTTTNEWIVYSGTPTYINATSFSFLGDQTGTFQVGRRIKTANTAGVRYSTISASVFGAVTTITVVNDSGTLDSGLSEVSYGILSAVNPSTPALIGATDVLHIEGTEVVTGSTQLTLEGRYGGYGAGISFKSKTSSGGTQVEMARITADGESAWDTTAANQDAGLNLYTTLDGVSSKKFNINSAGRIMTGTAASSPYNLTTASAANVMVDSSGYLYRSTSSIKYKTNVQDYQRGLSDVMALRPVTYQSKGKGDIAARAEKTKKLKKDEAMPAAHTFVGFIAEEVHAAGLTEFVQYAEDGTPDALGYAQMTALLVKAIQEQQAQIAALQAALKP